METFYISLKLMGIGLAGIFIFMFLFWLITVSLQKLFPYKPQEEPNQDSNSN